MDFQDDDDIRSHERRYVDTKYHFSQKEEGTSGEKKAYVRETTSDDGCHRQLFKQRDSYAEDDGMKVTKVETYAKGGFMGDIHEESDEGGAY